MARQPGKHALLFIFITVLIDVTGLGIIIPVIPEFIMELTGETIARAAVYGGALMFLYAIVQFFAAPVIGSLSDRYGRRPVLLLALFGFGTNYAIMGLAPNLAWLFAGRFLSGVFGATYTTASAYVADITEPEKRSANFGLIGAAFGLGFIIGPAIGGVLGDIDSRLPFFAAAALAYANLIYGLVVLPETLPEAERRPFDLRRANPVGSLMAMRPYKLVAGLCGVLLLYHIAYYSLPATWSYYTEAKFDWTPSDIGWSLAAVGLMNALVQGGLTRVLLPRVGDTRAVVFAFLVAILFYVGLAYATTGWMVYALIVVGSLASLSGPALQAALSNQVPRREQGQLQGAITSTMSLAAIIGPLIMSTWLFGTFAAEGAPVYFPGAPYLAAAALTVLALFAFARLMSRAGAKGARSAAERPGPAE